MSNVSISLESPGPQDTLWSLAGLAAVWDTAHKVLVWGDLCKRTWDGAPGSAALLRGDGCARSCHRQHRRRPRSHMYQHLVDGAGGGGCGPSLCTAGLSSARGQRWTLSKRGHLGMAPCLCPGAPSPLAGSPWAQGTGASARPLQAAASPAGEQLMALCP